MGNKTINVNQSKWATYLGKTVYNILYNGVKVWSDDKLSIFAPTGYLYNVPHASNGDYSLASTDMVSRSVVIINGNVIISSAETDSCVYEKPCYRVSTTSVYTETAPTSTTSLGTYREKLSCVNDDSAPDKKGNLITALTTQRVDDDYIEVYANGIATGQRINDPVVYEDVQTFYIGNGMSWYMIRVDCTTNDLVSSVEIQRSEIPENAQIGTFNWSEKVYWTSSSYVFYSLRNPITKDYLKINWQGTSPGDYVDEIVLDENNVPHRQRKNRWYMDLGSTRYYVEIADVQGVRTLILAEEVEAYRYFMLEVNADYPLSYDGPLCMFNLVNGDDVIYSENGTEWEIYKTNSVQTVSGYTAGQTFDSVPHGYMEVHPDYSYPMYILVDMKKYVEFDGYRVIFKKNRDNSEIYAKTLKLYANVLKTESLEPTDWTLKAYRYFQYENDVFADMHEEWGYPDYWAALGLGKQFGLTIFDESTIPVIPDEPVDDGHFWTLDDKLTLINGNELVIYLYDHGERTDQYIHYDDYESDFHAITYTGITSSSRTKPLSCLKYHWGENYTMNVYYKLLEASSNDNGGLEYQNTGPIELCFYSKGWYYDYHRPNSTTSNACGDYDFAWRLMYTNKYSGPHRGKVVLTEGTIEAFNDTANDGSYATSMGRMTNSNTRYTGYYDGLYENQMSFWTYYYFEKVEVFDASGTLVDSITWDVSNGKAYTVNSVSGLREEIAITDFNVVYDTITENGNPIPTEYDIDNVNTSLIIWMYDGVQTIDGKTYKVWHKLGDSSVLHKEEITGNITVYTGQWKECTTASYQKDGYTLFMSDSNKGVGSSNSWMRVEFEGIENFEFYFTSYAESSYDYAVVGTLDSGSASGTSPTSNPTQLSTSSSKQVNPSNSLTSWQKISFTNDSGHHYFWIYFRKDGSVNSNDDRGYIALPNMYNIVQST